YVLGEGRYGFFLEFDRGTMNTRDYRTKVDNYYRNRGAGHFAETYGSFPHVLFVTASDAAEKRFGRVAQAASAGQPPLRMWLTTMWRVQDPANRYGLIGRIWRTPGEPFEQREWWPPRRGALPQARITRAHA
ncbi:MAG TPA: hypothetical protein VK009_06455, partial [Chloroflexota bacterium]|nr:hypothetical protein [Chloroflexota bacterium]